MLDYINNLAKPERARVLEALEQVERRGFDAIRVEFRQIDGKLWEVKIGSHRVFYVMIDREEMVLLHATRSNSRNCLSKNERLPFEE